MAKCAANTFTKANVNRCFRGGGSEMLSVSESLWIFKVHGKNLIKTSDTQTELFSVRTCVLFGC